MHAKTKALPKVGAIGLATLLLVGIMGSPKAQAQTTETIQTQLGQVRVIKDMDRFTAAITLQGKKLLTYKTGHCVDLDWSGKAGGWELVLISLNTCGNGVPTDWWLLTIGKDRQARLAHLGDAHTLTVNQNGERITFVERKKTVATFEQGEVRTGTTLSPLQVPPLVIN